MAIEQRNEFVALVHRPARCCSSSGTFG